jgi:predicted RNase H-like nuclease (RuvC/YqgF family)
MADAIMHEVDGDEYDPDNDGIASEDGDEPVIGEAPPIGSGAARAMEEHRNDFEGADSDSDSEPEAESEADDGRERYAADNGPCSAQCLERALEQERRMEAMKDQHAAEVERLNEEIRELERQLAQLRLENEELRARKPRQTKKVCTPKLTSSQDKV